MLALANMPQPQIDLARIAYAALGRHCFSCPNCHAHDDIMCPTGRELLASAEAHRGNLPAQKLIPPDLAQLRPILKVTQEPPTDDAPDGDDIPF